MRKRSITKAFAICMAAALAVPAIAGINPYNVKAAEEYEVYEENATDTDAYEEESEYVVEDT